VVDVSEVNEHTKWRSEFNMAIANLQRLNEIQKALDQYVFIVKKGDQESLTELRSYWAALNSLYINLQDKMDIYTRKEFDILFKKAEIAISESLTQSKGGSICMSGHDKLVRLHGYLLRHMQRSGLGMPLSKQVSAKKKLRDLLDNKMGAKR
jgi:hypothetical protein